MCVYYLMYIMRVSYHVWLANYVSTLCCIDNKFPFLLCLDKIP